MAGDDWLHEPKWDGFRFQIIKDGGTVRLYSRHGAEYTDRLPGMVEAFGVDLRDLPLTERKRDLRRLCRKSRVPFMREVQTFPNGPLLLDHCNKFGFEGVVSKRLSSRYLSGPSRAWQKSKCPNWKRLNANRGKLFERPKKPAMTEDQKTLIKKREKLARVLERLQILTCGKALRTNCAGTSLS